MLEGTAGHDSGKAVVRLLAGMQALRREAVGYRKGSAEHSVAVLISSLPVGVCSTLLTSDLRAHPWHRQLLA